MAIEVTELNPVVPSSQVIEALGDVIDPELGVDLVNLGLVYGVTIIGKNVEATITLTTPGCPMHGTIEKEVLMTLERLPGVEFVDVKVVWDPPWSPALLTAEGRRKLHWL